MAEGEELHSASYHSGTVEQWVRPGPGPLCVTGFISYLDLLPQPTKHARLMVTREAKFWEFSKLETFHGNKQEFMGINGNFWD